MKKFLCLSLLMSSAMVHAADWTPVFKPLEEGCVGDSPVLSSITEQLITWQQQNDGSARPIVSKNAQQGKYRNVPQNYLRDMTPASIKKMNLGQDYPNYYTHIYVGLKNAQLYQLPIDGFAQYVDGENGVSGKIILFKPMTPQNYNRLKKIKFKIEPDVEFQGSIQKAPNGQVYLWCDSSM
ncbi:hypothetical protein [Acinetobacter sp. CFCC 10889]|uniref:hypothetical protein n=1 Tax=Acinetobacter sp. CFCC 10889 TaxID=1775557 RepID=UPI000DCF8DF3|nr:hypothetical protein [Acinetobacter sp. CFCC 10889]